MFISYKKQEKSNSDCGLNIIIIAFALKHQESVKLQNGSLFNYPASSFISQKASEIQPILAANLTRVIKNIITLLLFLHHSTHKKKKYKTNKRSGLAPFSAQLFSTDLASFLSNIIFVFKERKN